MLDFTEGTVHGTLFHRTQLNYTKPFEAGEKLCALEGLSRGPKAYTSVQCGLREDDHIELNSDLVYGRNFDPPMLANAGTLLMVVPHS